MRFDEFELQPSRRALLRGGEKIPIAPKTFDVLFFLVQNTGRVVLKEEILANVWPGSFVEESNLTQQIFSLRRALSDKADYIVNIPGRGYEFTGKVLIEEEAFPAEQETDTPRAAIGKAEVSASGHPRYRMGWYLTTAGVVLVTLIAWAGWHRLHRPVPGDHHEILLAGFENTTGEPAFDHALKTLLSIDLGQSPFLVISSDGDTNKVLKLMDRKPEDNLSPAIAREVCERLNDQAVLSGTIARFGQKYLVTLTANECTGGRELVQTKSVAKNAEDVLGAVDTVAADMRSRLGEPLQSLHRSGQPLLSQHTESLEALKLYSQASAIQRTGEPRGPIPLYQQAIKLDPKFAAAYWQMSICYAILGEKRNSEQAIAQAYEYRDQTDEPTRLAITGRYNEWITGDLYAELRNYQDWTTQFPQQADAWTTLSIVEANLGRFDLAVPLAQRGKSLLGNAGSPATLVGELSQNGQLDEALSVAHDAIARKTDTLVLHSWLLRLYLQRNDTAGIAEQEAWATRGSNEASLEWPEAYILLGQGKIHAALALHRHFMELFREKGQNQTADQFEQRFAYTLTLIGLDKEARAQLEASAEDPSDPNVMLYQANTGHSAEAQAEMDRLSQLRSQDTALQKMKFPIVRAAIALQRSKPAEAIVALADADHADFDREKSGVPYWTGLAYLANHQPDLAARQFTYSIEHTNTTFYALDIPLSHLELARALEAQGNHAAARKEFEAFFTLWKDADADLRLLKQAHTEYDKVVAVNR